MTQSVDLYNKHLKSKRHCCNFAQNNLKLTCTFCKLEEGAHNLKCHLESKRHKKSLQKCSFKYIGLDNQTVKPLEKNETIWKKSKKAQKERTTKKIGNRISEGETWNLKSHQEQKLKC